MSVSSTSREKLNWLFLESLLIVISILLAFWIDAWWTTRQERRIEQVTVQTLLDDLIIKQDLLASNRQNSKRVLESAGTLLSITSTEVQALSTDSISDLLGNLLWVSNESAWESAPINSLVMGGKLSVISNLELVSALSALQVDINRVRNYVRTDANFHQNSLAPFLNQNSNLVQIIKSMGALTGNPDIGIDLGTIEIEAPTDYVEILLRKEFKGLLLLKTENHISLNLNGYPRLESSLKRTIKLLRSELSLSPATHM